MCPIPHGDSVQPFMSNPDDAVLRQQLTRLEAIIEILTDAVYVIDTEGRLVFCNTALARMTGYTHEELLSQSSAMLYGTHFGALFREYRGRNLQGETVLPLLETELLRKDGSRLPVELAVSSFLFDERIVGRAVVVRDLSERRQAAAALRQSEEQFRLLVESVADYAIFTLDAKGYVVSWNLGAERIKGYRSEEIIGHHFACFYPPEDVQRGKPAWILERAMAEGHWDDEGWRLRKDGTRFWAAVVITALRDASGQLRGFGKVTRDLTEQRRLAQELRRTEQLALLGRLAASVSHELRNPLNTIFLHVDLLDEELRHPTPDGETLLRESVSELKNAVARLSDLVQDYLSLARLASLRRERADLGAFMSTYVQEIAEMLVPQGIVVDTDGLATLGHASFHPSTLRRVLDNVVQNAVEAMPGGGTIVLRGRRTDTEIVLDIQDTGEGIPAEHQAQVFEPLYTTKPEGTGLGLYLVREIVTAHEGHITLQSTAGAGTTFTITLPCSTTSSDVAVPPLDHV